MNLIYKTCLINLLIACALSALLTILFKLTIRDYFFATGALFLAGGTINAIIAIILMAAKKKEWAKGYLLSAGILILLGGIACSGIPSRLV